jgi:hypothetical protein
VKVDRHLLCCFLAVLLAGCAPSGDVSGWEMAPKRSREIQPESFPEIPVVLPATPTLPKASGPGSSMGGVYSKRLDQGSLFRRGYSAPTP